MMNPPQYNFPNRRYYSVQNTVMNEDFFNYFFVEKTDALKLLSEKEKNIVQQYFPVSEYAKIIFGQEGFLIENFRSSNRFVTRFRARLKFEETFENDIEVSVLDFSIAGLKLEASIELLGEVELRIGIGEYDSSYVKAQVRRKFEGVYGLEIVKADQAWIEFVADMQKQFKKATDEMPASLRDEVAE